MEKNSIELTFEKWENGKWFVVLPEYDGEQEDLEMVDGADDFLEFLADDGLYVNAEISLDKDERFPIKLKLAYHDEIGATYHVENLADYDKDIWLCNVVHFLYGEHPENLYFRIL